MYNTSYMVLSTGVVFSNLKNLYKYSWCMYPPSCSVQEGSQAAVGRMILTPVGVELSSSVASLGNIRDIRIVHSPSFLRATSRGKQHFILGIWWTTPLHTPYKPLLSQERKVHIQGGLIGGLMCFHVKQLLIFHSRFSYFNLATFILKW